MDPDKQDMEGSLGGAGMNADVPADADTTSEVRMTETTHHDETHPRHQHHDTASGVVDPAEIVVGRPTESSHSFVAADYGTESSTAHSTTVLKKQLVSLQQESDDELRSDRRLWPKAPPRSSDTASPSHSAAGGGNIPIDDRDACAEELPTIDPSPLDDESSAAGRTTPERAASQVHLSSPTGSSSNSSDAHSGGTDGEEQSATEGARINRPDMDSKEADQGGGGGGGEREHRLNDLPSQLHRIWGASPPDRDEGLAVMRDMLGYRHELDAILSRLVAVKV